MEQASRAVKTSVLALDLGASSGRAIVGTYDDDTGLVLREVHRFENGPKPNTLPLQWDYGTLLSNVIAGIHKASRDYELASVGIDTWGVDYGLIDSRGDLISNPVHYRDGRTDGLTAELEEDGRLDGVYPITGTQKMDINTLVQLIASKASNPSELKDADDALLMPDLLIYSLTGEKASEVSMASTTQLMDTRTGTWSEAVFERFGLRGDLFPPIVEEGSAAGTLKRDVHHDPIPVVRVCEHDTASAVASLSLTEDDLFISCGTWSLVGTKREQPVLTQEAERMNVTNERGDGGSTLLLKNCTGLWIAQELRRNLVDLYGEAPSWVEIARLAFEAQPFAHLIDTNDPIFEKPGNMVERINDWLVQAGQEQIDPTDIGALYRCVYESLALQYRESKEQLEKITGRAFKAVHLIGGGAQNKFLCQAVSDVMGCRVEAGPYEATAVGNILVQLVAAGAFASLSEARAAVAHSVRHDVYEPRIEFDELMKGMQHA